MRAYIRLLRLPNLVMIPLTMYLLRYCIIEPALKYVYCIDTQMSMQLQFPDLWFHTVVLINVFLGAAGYVINDYFDRKIDSVNRPEKVVVEKQVSRRTAIKLHMVLNALAVILSAWLSWQMRKPVVLIVYLMISGIFWLYSTTYKKQFLIGNLIVAFLTALVPLQVAYYDIVALNLGYGQQMIMMNLSFKSLLNWMLGFALFAFLTNLVREIIKDIEDFEGDKNFDCNTVPIVLGAKGAKAVVSALLIFIIGLIVYIYYQYLNDAVSKWYLLLMLVIPLISLMVMVLKAKSAKQYHTASTLMKFIMLFGVLYSLVARFIMVFIFSV